MADALHRAEDAVADFADDVVALSPRSGTRSRRRRPGRTACVGSSPRAMPAMPKTKALDPLISVRSRSKNAALVTGLVEMEEIGHFVGRRYRRSRRAVDPVVHERRPAPSGEVVHAALGTPRAAVTVAIADFDRRRRRTARAARHGSSSSSTGPSARRALEHDDVLAARVTRRRDARRRRRASPARPPRAAWSAPGRARPAIAAAASAGRRPCGRRGAAPRRGRSCALGGDLGEPLGALGAAAGQEALEHEARRCRSPLTHERHHQRGGSGHGGDRRTRRRRTARTSRSPGSQMPGVPASVTSATVAAGGEEVDHLVDPRPARCARWRRRSARR